MCFFPEDTGYRLALSPNPPYAFTEIVDFHFAVEPGLRDELTIFAQLLAATLQVYLNDPSTTAVYIGRQANDPKRLKFLSALEWGSNEARNKFAVSAEFSSLYQMWQKSGVLYDSSSPSLFTLHYLIQERHAAFMLRSRHTEEYVTAIVTFSFSLEYNFSVIDDQDYVRPKRSKGVVWNDSWTSFTNSISNIQRPPLCARSVSGWEVVESVSDPQNLVIKTPKRFLVAMRLSSLESAYSLFNDFDQELDEFTWRWDWHAMKRIADGGTKVEYIEMLALHAGGTADPD